MTAEADPLLVGERPDPRDLVFDGVVPPEVARRGPVMGDDLWDFREAIGRRTGAMIFDFTRVPEPHRWAAKHYAYQSLRTPARLAFGSKPPGALTIYTHLGIIRSLLVYLFEECNVEALSCLRQSHLDEWLLGRRESLSPESVRKVSATVIRFVARSATFPDEHDRVGFRAWGDRNPIAGGGTRNENLTRRLPEDVMAPLLWWAVTFVSHSDEVFAARAEAAVVVGNRYGPALSSRAAVAAEVARRRPLGRGIPVNGRTGAPNYSLLTQMGGGQSCDRGVLKVVDAALEELGPEPGGLDAEMSVEASTAKPWHPRMDLWEAAWLAPIQLERACSIVIAYLSGVRKSELANLTRGCSKVEWDGDGRVLRRKITGKVYKMQRSRDGRPVEWTVIEVVHQAIEILDRLTPGASADPLFSTLLSSSALKYFVAYCNAIAERLDLPDRAIPTDEALNWRRFRRTLAWHIANRPFGIVAGMIQYQHASVTMFEGYAGTTASGFRAEMDAEHLEAQVVNQYDLVLSGASGRARAGGHARTLANAVDRHFGGFAGVVRREKEVKQFLRAEGATIYSTPTNYCVFRAEGALCLDGVDPDDRAAPIPNHCDPFNCGNASITPRHASAWAEERGRVAVHLAPTRARPLPTNQRKVLEARLEHIDGVLAAITDNPGDSAPA